MFAFLLDAVDAETANTCEDSGELWPTSKPSLKCTLVIVYKGKRIFDTSSVPNFSSVVPLSSLEFRRNSYSLSRILGGHYLW